MLVNYMNRRVLHCAAFVALCSCSPKKQEALFAPTPTAPAAPAAPAAAAPCGGLPVRETQPVVLCTEVGDSSAPIDLRDEAGGPMGIVGAGVQIKVIDAPTIRRKPGHMDAKVCIATGERAGVVGYVQNTHFFGGDGCK